MTERERDLIKRSRNGEVIGDGSGQIAELLYQMDCAINGQAYTHHWYAARWERLRKLIEEKSPELIDEACCIMANGSANVSEPPTYEKILNQYRSVLGSVIQLTDSGSSYHKRAFARWTNDGKKPPGWRVVERIREFVLDSWAGTDATSRQDGSA